MILRRELKESRSGFTLVEMLIVIGIITVLTVAMATSFTHLTKKAEKSRTQELVSNVATALTRIYEKDGSWPKVIRDAVASGGGEGTELDANNNVALLLARRGFLTLAMDKNKSKLIGRDRFGILTPDAAKKVERNKNTELDTVKDRLLYFSVDLDGDGIVHVKGGARIRATAAVWCNTAKGDMVQSWSAGQARKVKEK